MHRFAVAILLLSSCAGDSAENLAPGSPVDANVLAPKDAGAQNRTDAGEQSERDSGNQPTPSGEATELAGITDAHNRVRAIKGLDPMVWDNDLAAVAQSWANTCVWMHNPGRSDNYPGYVGENLYGSSGTPNANAVVGSWASEESDYDYDSNSCRDVCGHYTQIVWESSLRLGCALSNCPGGQVQNIVVCNYSPGGNVNGARPY